MLFKVERYSFGSFRYTSTFKAKKNSDILWYSKQKRKYNNFQKITFSSCLQFFLRKWFGQPFLNFLLLICFYVLHLGILNTNKRNTFLNRSSGFWKSDLGTIKTLPFCCFSMDFETFWHYKKKCNIQHFRIWI